MPGLPPWPTSLCPRGCGDTHDVLMRLTSAVLFEKGFRGEVRVHMFGDTLPSLVDVSILHRQLLQASNALPTAPA